MQLHYDPARLITRHPDDDFGIVNGGLKILIVFRPSDSAFQSGGAAHIDAVANRNLVLLTHCTIPCDKKYGLRFTLHGEGYDHERRQGLSLEELSEAAADELRQHRAYDAEHVPMAIFEIEVAVDALLDHSS